MLYLVDSWWWFPYFFGVCMCVYSYLFSIIMLYVSVFVLIKALGLFGITKERRNHDNEKDNKDD